MTVKIKYSKKFLKQYYRLSPKVQQQFQQRLQLWLKEPFNPQLNNHILKEKYGGLHSINITGDIRALYDKIDDSYVIFGFIGSHSQLYG